MSSKIQFSMKVSVFLRISSVLSSKGKCELNVVECEVYCKDYPFSQILDKDGIKNCKNSYLKGSDNPRVLIDRIGSGPKYEFVALGEEEGADKGRELSKLKAQKGGICNDVTTQPGSYGCGLAKYLMKACYEDDEILGKAKKGYDVFTDELDKWEDEPNEADESANRLCQTITYTHCAPEIDSAGTKTPERACVSYMRGAIAADFDLIFIYKGPMGAMDVLNLIEAEKDFRRDEGSAKEFIKKHGPEWFFCKCKDGRKKECMDMTFLFGMSNLQID